MQLVAIDWGKLCIYALYFYIHIRYLRYYFPDATTFPRTRTTTRPAIGVIPSDVCHIQILGSNTQRNHEWRSMKISLPYSQNKNLHPMKGSKSHLRNENISSTTLSMGPAYISDCFDPWEMRWIPSMSHEIITPAEPFSTSNNFTTKTTFACMCLVMSS